MAQQTDLYFARRSFGYGQYDRLDRGQVIELLGLPNDERLVRLGYLMKLGSQDDLATCAECGAQFTGDAERAAHGSDRHTPRDLTPREEDEREQRRERQLEQTSPLFLENSKASKAAGSGRRIRVPD